MAENFGSYIIEVVRLGNQVKVTACEPESGVEASIITPLTATHKERTDLAIKKLQYVLRKKTEEGNDDLV